MAKKLAPYPLQILDSNGAPISGALIFTYTAGSSTKLASYTDATGVTAHSNPIVCDSDGRYGQIWLDEGVEYKILAAPAADTDPPTSPLKDLTIDDVVGITDNTAANSQWLATGHTPTRLSGTQFTVAGDQTTTYQVNRRIQMVDSGGTKYGYVSASSYSSPNTTVTAIVDASGTIQTGLTSISIALLTSTDVSVPQDYIQRDVVGHVNFAKATVASHATTSAIWAATGNLIDFTGVEVITDFPAADQAGSSRTLVFAGACTITDNANITVVGGTQVATINGVAIVYAITTTTFLVTFLRSGLIPLSVADASASATIDFTGLDGTYDHYVFKLKNIAPVTNATALLMQVGTGATPTWETANYAYHIPTLVDSAATYAAVAAASAANILLTGNLTSSAALGASGDIAISGVGDTGNYKFIRTLLDGFSSSGSVIGGAGIAVSEGATAPITAVRFLFLSGNIASGRIAMYGVKNA